jgi:hypothetical protein
MMLTLFNLLMEIILPWLRVQLIASVVAPLRMV